jgi:poly(hydroxyalkanoate) granule-associated protein
MSARSVGRARRAPPQPQPQQHGGLLGDSLQSGFRKLEEVFDERVASALERLGIPSARTVARLEERIEQLAAQVRHLRAPRSRK